MTTAPGLDDRAVQDRAAVDAGAARRSVAPRRPTVPPVSFASGGDRGRRAGQAVAARPGDGRGRRAAEDEVGGAADEGLRGAEVQPVGGVDHALQVGARGQQAGERLALHGDRAARRDRVDDRAAEDVGARVDLVGDDLLGRLRLLQERRDPARRVGRDQAEGARVLDPGQVQGDVRAGARVPSDQGADVEAGEDVAVEDQDRVVGSPECSREATLRIAPPVPSGLRPR